MDRENDHVALLRRHVREERLAEYDTHIDWLFRNDEWYCIDGSFLGFMEDYENIAALVNRKITVHLLPRGLRGPLDEPRGPFTVYDVGCATALQHVLFDERAEYVGIDENVRAPDPTFFRNRCRFVRGRFSGVVDSLCIDRETSVGIANMSLLYGGGPEELRAFDRAFNRKIIL